MTRTAITHVPDIAGAANANWAPRPIAATPATTQALAASAWAFSASREMTLAMLTWYARDRERRALAALDGRMLRDIGLTRTDVQVEVEKRIWER